MGGPTMPDPNGSTAVDSSSSDKPTAWGKALLLHLVKRRSTCGFSILSKKTKISLPKGEILAPSLERTNRTVAASPQTVGYLLVESVKQINRSRESKLLSY